ncbi:MAG: hypothetical protein HRT57_17440 [Crocinitomicaceae bacterium]|nr:hypothetical protein [Crocinitomicaceae bacterium]
MSDTASSLLVDAIDSGLKRAQKMTIMQELVDTFLEGLPAPLLKTFEYFKVFYREKLADGILFFINEEFDYREK